MFLINTFIPSVYSQYRLTYSVKVSSKETLLTPKNLYALNLSLFFSLSSNSNKLLCTLISSCSLDDKFLFILDISQKPPPTLKSLNSSELNLMTPPSQPTEIKACL